MARGPQQTPFLLLSRARTLSLKDVFAMGEDGAYGVFCKLRWPETDGAPVCPKCGCLGAYFIATRRRYECREKGCRKHFSVTSGTIFASRKLPFVDMLAAIAIVVNGAKGVSALQLARDLDHQHKSMWVLVHKIREAMVAETAETVLAGAVEVDGAWFGGHVKPENKVEDRKDRRKAKNRSHKRRSVVAAREKRGRTRTLVVKHEADGVEPIAKVIAPGSTVHADEATHWDVLHAKFATFRINHSEAYSLNGICTNQAESFFSRLRKMVEGQHHHVSPQYLHAYAAHAAWLEDHRREDNGKLCHRALGLALGHPVSRVWKGYWQRTERG
jgi:transposase-like protein